MELFCFEISRKFTYMRMRLLRKCKKNTFNIKTLIESEWQSHGLRKSYFWIISIVLHSCFRLEYK